VLRQKINFRSLSRQDIQTLVGFGCPSVDKKVVFSAKLLRKRVQLDEGDVSVTFFTLFCVEHIARRFHTKLSYVLTSLLALLSHPPPTSPSLFCCLAFQSSSVFLVSRFFASSSYLFICVDDCICDYIIRLMTAICCMLGLQFLQFEELLRKRIFAYQQRGRGTDY
jgi:hypothetical protein